MSGGIVQLVATGAQDTWLTGKPEISFFRSNYKRYTHYALSSERQIIQGNPSAGSISTIRFEKKGDLLSYVYFIGKDTNGALIPGIDWSKVVDRIELLIGGQVVDTQDITWMTQVEPVTGAQNYSQRYLNNDLTGLTNVINGFLPLKFFFCKDWSVALPLVALQYHDVELRITWSQNLNYRVNYEIYSVTAPSTSTIQNLATATAVANPVTGTGAGAPAGSGGAMALSVSNQYISTLTNVQSNSFSYTGANFQLVPGMTIYGSAGGAIGGSATINVISVSANTASSGFFTGFMSSAITGGALAPTAAAPSLVPYTTLTTSPQALGAPFIITGATIAAAGFVATYTITSSGFYGYPSVGMYCTNLPGTSTTGYISAITYASGGSMVTGSVAVTFQTAAQATAAAAATPIASAVGFSSPPTSNTVTITPVMDPTVGGGTLTWTPTYNGGQISIASSAATATSLIPGVYTLTLTQPSSGGSAVYTATVLAASATISPTSLQGSGFTSTTGLVYTYSAANQSRVTYTVPATTVLNGTLYPGQSIPQSTMPAGTVGTGYVGVVTAASGFVTSFQVLYAVAQNVTTTAAVAATFFAPANASFTSTRQTTVSTNLSVIGTTVADNTITGYLVPGMSVSGLVGTTGTGYIYQINGSTSGTTNTPVAPGGQTTSLMIYYPTAPTFVGTYSTSVPALAPVGTVQNTVAGQTVYPNVVVYGLGVGAISIPVNSVITTASPAGTGATLFQVTSIAHLSAGVALVTLALYGTPVNGVSQTPTITGGISILSPVTSTLPVFTPSYPVVNILTATPTGTPVGGSTVLGQATLGNNPLGSVNTVYGAATGGYLMSINTNQQLAAGLPASTINGYYTGVALAMVPSSYYCGVITGTPPTFTTTGGSMGSLAIGQATQVGIVPKTAAYFYTTAGSTGQSTTLTNPAIAASTASALTVNYTAASASTAFNQYTQFAVIPQAQLFGQLSSAQPSVDRQSTALISLAYLSGSIPVAVGQSVLGTNYAGPVTVNQIVSASGGTVGLSTSVATIELSFPTQTQTALATTGASTFIQFIDPTQSLGSGVTASGSIGFNGTYQQLQYEAWCSYLYLDGPEREYFASTPMDMIVTQVNRVPINPLSTHEVNLAHPVKFLAFVSNNYTTAYAAQATASNPTAASYRFKTQLNGVDVGDSRSLFQWQDVPQYYHTPFGYKAAGGTAPVTLISYCLDTSKLQPTGTLNFSRLDSYRIITPSNSSLAQIAGGTSGYIYAVNYNILRIQKGMGSMLYSS